MSIVRKISRDVLSDALLEEIDNKLSEDEKLSYNNLLDKPFIPEPITEVPETLLSTELQEKINNMISVDDTVDWSQLENIPDFSTLDFQEVKDYVEDYVDPKITSLQEEINGKMEIGSVVTKEQVLPSLSGSIGTTELTTDLSSIINNKMNKGSSITYSQIVDPPVLPDGLEINVATLNSALSSGERLQFKASASNTNAPLNIGVGVSPTILENGDMWNTSTGLQLRINNATRSVYHTGNVTTMSLSEAQTGIGPTGRFVSPELLKTAIESLAPVKGVNPETTGVFYHKGNGAGNTDVILKIQSNNGILTGSSDTSSNFHVGGVGVAFDNRLFVNGGMTFSTANQVLDLNAASLQNVSKITNRGSYGLIKTGSDFNDGNISTADHNFVVTNSNIASGQGSIGNAWSYQAYVGTDRVFGVKADGSIVSPNSTMTESEAITGTATTERLVTASVLKKAIETHAPTIHTSETTPTNNAEIWYKIIG